MKKFRIVALAAVIGAAWGYSAMAQDDNGEAAAAAPAATEKVTRASKNVPELVLGTKEHQFAVNRVWMDQIVIDDLEVHMNGAPAWLEYDADGTIQVQFTTVRPAPIAGPCPTLPTRA